MVMRFISICALATLAAMTTATYVSFVYPEATTGMHAAAFIGGIIGGIIGSLWDEP